MCGEVSEMPYGMGMGMGMGERCLNMEDMSRC